jgi:hypothetical protein
MKLSTSTIFATIGSILMLAPAAHAGPLGHHTTDVKRSTANLPESLDFRYPSFTLDETNFIGQVSCPYDDILRGVFSSDDVYHFAKESWPGNDNTILISPVEGCGDGRTDFFVAKSFIFSDSDLSFMAVGEHVGLEDLVTTNDKGGFDDWVDTEHDNVVHAYNNDTCIEVNPDKPANLYCNVEGRQPDPKGYDWGIVLGPAC